MTSNPKIEVLNPCSVEGCGRSSSRSSFGCKGLCTRHYLRLLRHGDPLGGGLEPGRCKKWIEENVSHDGDDCLDWPFSRSVTGYGHLAVDRKGYLASRYMCILAHGNPPTSDHVAAHSCGNGHLGCVNPKHIRWATQKENCADIKIHGRKAGGAAGKTKLTDEAVAEIRSSSSSQRELAAKFGVSQPIISRVKSGHLWRPDYLSAQRKAS